MSANTIGNVLKEARTKKSVTFEEVHAKIKIHPRVLQILEDGRFEKLPSPLFVRSFIKNYAEFLEINPEDLLKAYEKEGGKKNPEQILFLKPADPNQGKPLLDRNTLVALMVLAVILLGGAGIFYAFKTKAHWLPKAKPRQAAALKASKSKEALGEPKAQSVWLRSVELENFPKLSSKTQLSLKIRASENVWLRVTCDGKILFQSTLKRGASETWTANQAIEVWTGNSSSMSLTLNKYALGSPGKGVVKKMAITHDGVRVEG